MGETIMVKEQPALSSRVDELERRRSEDYREFAQILNSLATQMHQGFARVEQRFEKIDERFEKMEQRFEKMDRRFDEMHTHLEKRFNRIDNNLAFMRLECNGRHEVMLEAYKLTDWFAHRVEDKTIDLDKRVDIIERARIFGAPDQRTPASSDG